MAIWRTRRLIFFDLERQRSPIVDMALLLGGLVAFNAPPSLRMTTVIASLLGLYHGYANGAGMGEPSTAAIALSGLSFAVFVIVALASNCNLSGHESLFVWREAGSRRVVC
jgi:hydrogenase/urease accessory protein HupE